MDIVGLRAEIAAYSPGCQQEAMDRVLMLSLIDTLPGILTRDCGVAHFTASAWIVNPARDRVLLIYHNIYDSWAWTGGHADGEADLLSVAIREAREETGLKMLRPVGEAPISLEIITVDGHERRGRYVPSHLHLNLTYLLEADDAQAVFVKADENSGVMWAKLDEVGRLSTEPWMIRRIYDKLNGRIKRK